MDNQAEVTGKEKEERGVRGREGKAGVEERWRRKRKALERICDMVIKR